ncbi:L-glutamate gamma-semialdehyde dehydrogenase [Cumulibacter manganitolerans]|uniref:L-glutamate gamma-semialdehyde dehydrogenase n=1 Tax=Cumulibacter manganitolerans TaxID=1884992 RepID=UPI0012971E8C|nr:L-glutamate gamma-semialdehyde dehydrogenase [Cumulibacter manganitolerans]
MNAITTPPPPVNEPVRTYEPGSADRSDLQAALDAHDDGVELPAVIGGKEVMGRGQGFTVAAPHDHRRVLAVSAQATAQDGQDAVDAALAAAPEWAAMSFDDRAGVFLRAADLLAGPWRMRMNAATMLGQGKSCYQAEIDAACELIDFWRFNVAYARQIYAEQPPAHAPGVWNSLEYRPLEGFVYAITPFNFTSIGGNLPTAPALMGNVVLWKPSMTQQLAASLTMQLLQAAGLPDGVINMLPGHGAEVSKAALASEHLAGVHFTGSTRTFQGLWGEVGSRIGGYRGYPRLVGETGGKDFVVAHASADPDAVLTALVRGAFEYSGQKCSAASRAYLPRSLWRRLEKRLAAETDALPVGSPLDFSNFTGPVIDAAAFAKHRAAIDRARATPGVSVLAGGDYDDSEGYFVRPTVLVGEDPEDEMFRTEYFGPILSVYVYADRDYEKTLGLVDRTAAYALTGAVLARDARAIATARAVLRNAAGNFYINDKPTGAVVGQQPFGGSRASGTNDKAGSPINLQRWVSARAIKQTFVPPTAIRYPHQG